MIAEIIFIGSIALIAYSYAGYPAVAFALSRLLGCPARQSATAPSVSVVIAAYNEEKVIAAKIENTLALDYPSEKIEIIVASDCSSDATDEIVRGFAARGVALHRSPQRLGKTVAQNLAVKVSSGEILVFSDATTMYEPDAVRKIVRSFADPEVGCVTGQLVYVDHSQTAVSQGCRSYWGYEKLMRSAESNLGSLITVSGCLYAVRRSSYVRLALDANSDFAIAIETHLQGLRTIYAPEAIATEDTNRHSRDEFRMRVRVIGQTMSTLYRYREVLNPLRHGMFAFQMISHKVMRYAVPLLLITAFASNAILYGASDFHKLAFIAQSALYFAALAGLVADRARLKLGFLGLPYYFCLANFAAFTALVKFISGKAQIVWLPVRDTRIKRQADGAVVRP